jgi:hypothetical protein
VIRFWNDEVLKNLDDVILEIDLVLQEIMDSSDDEFQIRNLHTALSLRKGEGLVSLRFRFSILVDFSESMAFVRTSSPSLRERIAVRVVGCCKVTACRALT